MSDPGDDRDALAKIQDPGFPTSNVPEPRTVEEGKKFDRDAKRLTPTEKLERRLDQLIGVLTDQVDGHRVDNADLRTQIDTIRTQLSDLRVDHAALKVAHSALQGTGGLTFVMIAAGGVGASVGSYFLPNLVAWIFLTASLSTFLWGIHVPLGSWPAKAGDLRVEKDQITSRRRRKPRLRQPRSPTSQFNRAGRPQQAPQLPGRSK